MAAWAISARRATTTTTSIATGSRSVPPSLCFVEQMRPPPGYPAAAFLLRTSHAQIAAGGYRTLRLRCLLESRGGRRRRRGRFIAFPGRAGHRGRYFPVAPAPERAAQAEACAPLIPSALWMRIFGGWSAAFLITRLGQTSIKAIAVAVEIGLGRLFALGFGIEFVVGFPVHGLLLSAACASIS